MSIKELLKKTKSFFSHPLLLGLYNLSCALIGGLLFFDTAAHNYSLWIFFSANTESTSLTIAPLMYTISGSLIGASILCLKGLHRYAVLEKKFNAVYFGSYVLGPWAASVVGIVVFCSVKVGLFVFGNKASITDDSQQTDFTYFLIGFLSGFSWEKALEKLNRLANELFRDLEKEKSQEDVVLEYWLEDLPDCCPPENAFSPQGEIFFRLTHSSSFMLDDFYSQRHLHPDKNFPGIPECIARSISLCGDIKTAMDLKKLPRFKKTKVLQLKLNKDSGVCMRTLSSQYKNHYSWWVKRDFNKSLEWDVIKEDNTG